MPIIYVLRKLKLPNFWDFGSQILIFPFLGVLGKSHWDVIPIFYTIRRILSSLK
jgi:hypothetical protein